MLKISLIEVIFFDLEAIVQIPNPLAQLTVQAGGWQERSTKFHGKFIPA